MFGNAVSALSMWVLLMLLTKTTSVETVGIFAVAQAVGLPISKFLSLKLQLVQVTDARNDYAFGHYYALKLVMAVATVATIAVVGFGFYPVYTALVVLALGIGYAIIELREMFLATMQKAERMDKITVSRVLQGLLSLVLFGGLFWVTRDLIVGIVGLIAARLGVLMLYDVPVSKTMLAAEAESGGRELRMASEWNWSKLWRLARLAAPLGLVAWLTTLFTSVPRLVLDKAIGTAEVGYFAALSSLLLVGKLMTGALGQTVIPRLSIYYVEKRRAFWGMVIKVVGVALLLGVLGIAASALFGKLILTVLFTSAYAQHDWVFVNVMIAASVSFLFSCMNMSLTAARKFAVQFPLYALAAVAAAASAWLLIPTYGMLGAAWSLLICYSTGFSGCLIALIVVSHREGGATARRAPASRERSSSGRG